MPTECIPEQLEFEAIDRHRVVAAFDGGAISTDAGALLLRHCASAIRLFDRVASCFIDHRTPELVVHELSTLVGQRSCGIALGYEDLNDHNQLRHDPILALLSDRLEAKRKDCAVLSGKSTLNRLEHAPSGAPDRYRRIGHDREAMERLFVDLYLDAHAAAPARIMLDLDATDDRVHGTQEGRFYHGYYKSYCYLPLYITCGRHLLAAKLRPANIDGAAGPREEVARIVAQIRERWPRVEIVLRADSGFARDNVMAWCEANGVGYLFGLAQNARLRKRIAGEAAVAKAAHARTGRAQRRFADFSYSTRKSWSRARRVVGKAEHLAKGANPRFVVTSLPADVIKARRLYERLYCARGEMENRIKECQLDLFADRTSAATMRANQLRLWFASLAYVLVDSLRRIALPGTTLARATAGSIRLKLLKIGARVTVSVRRIKVAMASAHPWKREFSIAHERLSIAAR